MLADWGTIAPPTRPNSLNVLRADGSHPLDYRIGRDARGRFAFQLDAPGARLEPATLDPPAGMDVIVDEIGGGAVRLTLLLHDAADFEIFRVLCGDLLHVTRDFAPHEAPRAVRVLLGRLGQWQEVLARRRRARLTRNEIVGLFGELVFLRDVLAARLGLAAAVLAWRGPYGDEQDFAIDGAIIEVKTQGTTADRRLLISSEDQLDTSACSIFICRQCLGASSKGAGETLDAVIAGLLARTAEEPSVKARLRIGLEAAGWADDAGYDETFRIDDREYFAVGNGFPRIVPADLRPGVERVRYQVAVADCRPFLVEPSAIFGETQS